MRGYIVCSQWHSTGVKTLEDVLDHRRHKGDAAVVDQLIGFRPPKILAEQPRLSIGNVCFRVEDDDSLTLVDTYYDTSG